MKADQVQASVMVTEVDQEVGVGVAAAAGVDTARSTPPSSSDARDLEVMRAVHGVIRKTWLQGSDERPTATQVLLWLETIQDQYIHTTGL